MQRILGVLFVLVGCFSTSFNHAQNQNPKNQEYVTEAAAVLSIYDRWIEASTDCDAEALARLYHPKISFWPSAAKEPFYGIDEVVNVFMGMCERNSFLIVESVKQYVDLLDNTAVVFGALQFRQMLNEQLTYIPARFSFTIVREEKEAEWKIMHMQSMVVPFSPTPETTDSSPPQ